MVSVFDLVAAVIAAGIAGFVVGRLTIDRTDRTDRASSSSSSSSASRPATWPPELPELTPVEELELLEAAELQLPRENTNEPEAAAVVYVAHASDLADPPYPGALPILCDVHGWQWPIFVTRCPKCYTVPEARRRYAGPAENDPPLG